MAQFSITTTTTTTMTTTITTTMTTTTHHFSSLVFSYLILFCSFIFSYPLYFSYFIFFFPYLLKLFSFLSPLFITTSLFLLVFLTYHNNSCLQNPESKVGFLLNSYQKVLNTLGWNLDEENVQNFLLLEDLEACMLVLDSDNQNYLHFVEKTGEFKELELNAQGKTGEFLNVEERAGEFKELVISLEEKTREFEEVTLDVEEKAGKSKELALDIEVKPGDFEEEQEDEFQDVANILGDKPGEFQELAVTVPQETGDSTQHSSLHEVSHSSTTPELTSKPPVEEFSLTKPSNNYKEKLITQQQPPPLKKYEMLCSATIAPTLSMRKEKEWKRTLACKLYEERQNSQGSEGMDLLWEEYEADTAKAKKRNVKKETEYEDEEEDEEVHVKLCCLQALKMSTGKMNLGMKKPSLVKFSKALKGIGWLHHHVSSKYGNNRVKST